MDNEDKGKDKKSSDKSKVINNDFTNARINKLEQQLHTQIEHLEISSDIPEDLKDSFKLWMELSVEDLHWKKEQRVRMDEQTKEIERIARAQEKIAKENSINKRANFLARFIVFPLLSMLTLAIAFYVYFRPLYYTSILPRLGTAAGLNKITVWLDWLPHDNKALFLFMVGMAMVTIFLLILSKVIADKLLRLFSKE